MFTVCELRFNEMEDFAEATDGKVKVSVGVSDYNGDYVGYTNSEMKEHIFCLDRKVWLCGEPGDWKEDYFKVAEQLRAILAKGPQPL